MTYQNGKTLGLEYEPAGPLCGQLDFRAFNRACDRFLVKRGLITAPSFRRSEWLFGRPAMKRRAA